MLRVYAQNLGERERVKRERGALTVKMEGEFVVLVVVVVVDR